MKCTVCGKEFRAIRSTAKYCSGACRVQGFRVSVTNNAPSVSVAGNVLTDNETLRQSLGLCKHKECWLGKCAGQNDLCIYHWRISEHMPHISPRSYSQLNVEAQKRLSTGLLQAR